MIPEYRFSRCPHALAPDNLARSLSVRLLPRELVLLAPLKQGSKSSSYVLSKPITLRGASLNFLGDWKSDTKLGALPQLGLHSQASLVNLRHNLMSNCQP